MVSNFRTLKVFGFLLGGLFAVVAWVRTYDVQLLARDKQKLAQQETIAWVNDFSWGNFSSLLAGFYRQNGYEVEEVNGGRGNIVDLLLRRDGKKTLVHCNHWKEFEVNVRTVKKLYRAQIQEGADKAVLITCGDYTKSALAFAEGKSLKLIAGNHCVEMVQQVQRNLRASGVPLPEVLMRKAA
ncbi:MAG: restriction endonuclease [Pedosphaera sp.]|nr:restriction endonuclease [Pedosphaera sp.]